MPRTIILAQYEIGIKQHPLLKKQSKKLTQDHIALKSDMFLFKEIKHGWIKLFNDNVPRNLILKVRISIMYYGLLCYNEILFIEIKDVVVQEVMCIDYLCTTKRHTKGFYFKAPEWLVPSFETYISQISIKVYAKLQQKGR